jgi:hypothetical protein
VIPETTGRPTIAPCLLPGTGAGQPEASLPGHSVDSRGSLKAARDMALTDFSTLTFDVIGTLIDFETGVLEWMRPRLQAAKADVTDDKILQVAPLAHQMHLEQQYAAS